MTVPSQEKSPNKKAPKQAEEAKQNGVDHPLDDSQCVKGNEVGSLSKESCDESLQREAKDEKPRNVAEEEKPAKEANLTTTSRQEKVSY